jgi:hypothetical protein
MSARTVTIPTSDHGDVTIPDPPWCTGQFHESGELRYDITHTGPDIELTTATEDGPEVILRLTMEQQPFGNPDTFPGTDVHVAVELLDGHHPRDAAGLDRLADDLIEAARRVRLMGRRLAAETSRPGRRPADPAAILADMARRLAEEVTAQRGPWADITPEGGHRSATSQQAVGPYVVRLQAAIYAGGGR